MGGTDSKGNCHVVTIDLHYQYLPLLQEHIVLPTILPSLNIHLTLTLTRPEGQRPFHTFSPRKPIKLSISGDDPHTDRSFATITTKLEGCSRVSLYMSECGDGVTLTVIVPKHCLAILEDESISVGPFNVPEADERECPDRLRIFQWRF